MRIPCREPASRPTQIPESLEKSKNITNLSHRDLAVGLIKGGTKQTAIVSAYMDIKNKPITDQLQAALDNQAYGSLSSRTTKTNL